MPSRRQDFIAPAGRLQALFALPRTASAAAVGLLLYASFLRRGVGEGRALAAALPFVVAAAAGAMLNDYHDRDRDAIDKPWRAIPAGHVRAGFVAPVAFLMIGGAAVGSLAVGYSRAQLAMAWAALLGVSCYHLVIRRAAALKAPYIAILTSLPVACAFAGTSVSTFRPMVATITFVCGRELLMDVLDVAGDAATESRTVAVRLGASACSTLGFLMLAVGAALFGPAIAAREGAFANVIVALVLGAALALWGFRPGTRRVVIYLLWLPLLVGLGVLVRQLESATAN